MDIDCMGHRRRIEKLEKQVEILMQERDQRIHKENLEEKLNMIKADQISRGFNPSRLTLDRGL